MRSPRLLATACAALALAVAVAPPGPSAQVTPEPSASPAARAPLPEIGRIRATSAACAAMRDLVIPAFAAARRADMRFTETQKRLPNYGEIVADPLNQSGIVRESALHRLSMDAATLLQESQQIAKLLGDPRLSSTVTDPAVVAERARLQELYAAQQTRAAILSEFTQRESMALARANVGMEGNGAFSGRGKTGLAPAAQSVDALPGSPLPATSAQPGMPLLNGDFPALNRRQMSEWGNVAAKIVHDAENDAAKTFLPLANGCR
jgi:hypothetical protein